VKVRARYLHGNRLHQLQGIANSRLLLMRPALRGMNAGFT
jgi:hypothetical protein